MKTELIEIKKLQEININGIIEYSSKQEQIDALIEQNKYLQERVDQLTRMLFASKSEKIPDNQPSLFDDSEEIIEVVEDEEIEITFKRKKGGRTSPPKDIPRVRVEHDISEEEKICNCGDTMHRVKEIVSEQYDIIPAKFQIIQNVRFVYGCRCGEKPLTTPLAPC